MARANRVQPDSTSLATAARGLFTGNRGILHDAQGAMGRALWRHKAWICCTLDLRPGRPPRPIATPGHYTPLFFDDEAVALAAGHRHCAECRRDAFRAFAAALGGLRAPDIDRLLHAARLDPATGSQGRHLAQAETLPDGVFVLHGGRACLIHQDAALPHAPGGYAAPLPRPRGLVPVLTPAPGVQALQAGYTVRLHASVAGTLPDKSMDKASD